MTKRPRAAALLWGGLGIAASVAAVLLIGGVLASLFLQEDNKTPAAGSDRATGPTSSTSTEAIQLASNYAATTSGTQYTSAALDQQVHRLVTTAVADSPSATPTTSTTTVTESPTTTTSPTTSESASPTTTPSDGSTVDTSGWTPPLKRALTAAIVTDPAAAQACVQDSLESTATPLAFDLGTYDGRPAVIVVLPLNGTQAEVWVIDPRCSGLNPVIRWMKISLP